MTIWLQNKRDAEWATGLERAPPVCVQLKVSKDAPSLNRWHTPRPQPCIMVSHIPSHTSGVDSGPSNWGRGVSHWSREGATCMCAAQSLKRGALSQPVAHSASPTLYNRFHIPSHTLGVDSGPSHCTPGSASLPLVIVSVNGPVGRKYSRFRLLLEGAPLCACKNILLDIFFLPIQPCSKTRDEIS